MNVEDDTLVIVRGINDDFFKENFGNLCISFGGDSRAVPVKDAYYVGLYLGAPDSAITHIGIVEKIERGDTPLYVNANICDIKQHYPDAFYNPAIDRLYRLKEFVEEAVE